MSDTINTTIRTDGTLEIYLGNRLLAEVSDRSKDAEAIEDILYRMGYVWKRNGHIEKIEGV